MARFVRLSMLFEKLDPHYDELWKYIEFTGNKCVDRIGVNYLDLHLLVYFLFPISFVLVSFSPECLLKTYAINL